MDGYSGFARGYVLPSFPIGERQIETNPECGATALDNVTRHLLLGSISNLAKHSSCVSDRLSFGSKASGLFGRFSTVRKSQYV